MLAFIDSVFTKSGKILLAKKLFESNSVKSKNGCTIKITQITPTINKPSTKPQKNPKALSRLPIISPEKIDLIISWITFKIKKDTIKTKKNEMIVVIYGIFI